MAFRALGFAVALALLPSAALAQNAGPALAAAARAPIATPRMSPVTAPATRPRAWNSGASSPASLCSRFHPVPAIGAKSWRPTPSPPRAATSRRWAIRPTRLPARFENAATFGTINYTSSAAIPAHWPRPVRST